MSKIKTIGILTSGGDSPGMNAAIRAAVASALRPCKLSFVPNITVIASSDCSEAISSEKAPYSLCTGTPAPFMPRLKTSQPAAARRPVQRTVSGYRPPKAPRGSYP